MSNYAGVPGINYIPSNSPTQAGLAPNLGPWAGRAVYATAYFATAAGQTQERRLIRLNSDGTYRDLGPVAVTISPGDHAI